MGAVCNCGIIHLISFKMKTLTRIEMKQILGGRAIATCIFSINGDNGCGGGFNTVSCGGDLGDCQDAADGICAGSNCCDDVDCR